MKRYTKCLTVGLLLLSLLVAALQVSAENAPDTIGRIKVTSDGFTNIRSADNGKASVIMKAFPGEIYTCIAKTQSSWYEILLPDNKIGYIYQGSATLMGLFEFGSKIDEFNMRILENPADALAYQDRAAFYLERGVYDIAVDDFSSAIALEGTVYQYIGRAEALRSIEAYEEALADACSAIEVDGANPMGYVSKARILIAMQRYEEAMDDLQAALAIDGKDGIIHYWLGYCLEKLEKPEEALDKYLTAVKYITDQATIYYRIGLIYMDNLENYKEAVKWFNQAIKKSGDNMASYYASRGRAYVLATDYKNAIADLEKAIQLQTDDAVTYDALAVAYYETKNAQKALENIEKAISLAPDDLLYQEHLNQIKQMAK